MSCEVAAHANYRTWSIDFDKKCMIELSISLSAFNRPKPKFVKIFCETLNRTKWVHVDQSQNSIFKNKNQMLLMKYLCGFQPVPGDQETDDKKAFFA